MQPTNESTDPTKKHLEDLDEAQDQRLENMFEELEQCNIERLSVIDSRDN